MVSRAEFEVVAQNLTTALRRTYRLQRELSWGLLTIEGAQARTELDAHLLDIPQSRQAGHLYMLGLDPWHMREAGLVYAHPFASSPTSTNEPEMAYLSHPTMLAALYLHKSDPEGARSMLEEKAAAINSSFPARGSYGSVHGFYISQHQYVQSPWDLGSLVLPSPPSYLLTENEYEPIAHAAWVSDPAEMITHIFNAHKMLVWLTTDSALSGALSTNIRLQARRCLQRELASTGRTDYISCARFLAVLSPTEGTEVWLAAKGASRAIWAVSPHATKEQRSRGMSLLGANVGAHALFPYLPPLTLEDVESLSAPMITVLWNAPWSSVEPLVAEHESKLRARLLPHADLDPMMLSTVLRDHPKRQQARSLLKLEEPNCLYKKDEFHLFAHDVCAARSTNIQVTNRLLSIVGEHRRTAVLFLASRFARDAALRDDHELIGENVLRLHPNYHTLKELVDRFVPPTVLHAARAAGR